MDLEQMVKDVLKNTSPQTPVEPEPAEVNIADSGSPRIKGEPKRLFDPAAGLGGAANALSDFAVDMRHYNAVHVDVIVTGSSASATISVEGSTEEGGFSQVLPGANASKTGVAATTSFDVICGAAWARVRIASISGSYGAGQGFTIIVTPFACPGLDILQLLAGTALIGKVGIDQTTPSTTDRVTAGGIKTRIAVSFTRPANATAYTAKDALGVSLTVTGATNASPIVITCATHSLADGDPITIASVGGNTAANVSGYAKVTGYSSTTFGLYSDKSLATPVAGNGAYTSGGTVAIVLRFAALARKNGGSGYIVKATIMTDQTTNTESFRLHLYNAPPAAILDNAVCTAPLYADASKYVGTLDFPACKTEGTGVTAAYANVTGNISGSNLPLAYVCAAADTDLYAIPETPAGFTPASGQLFTINLVSESD